MGDASLLCSTALEQPSDKSAWKRLGWGLPRAGERMGGYFLQMHVPHVLSQDLSAWESTSF